MGAGLSQLTEEQLKDLRENTSFSDRDLVKLLKRYASFDPSERGTEGIEPKALLAMPELAFKPMMPRVLQLYSDPTNGRIFPEKFLYMFASLSSTSSLSSKRESINGFLMRLNKKLYLVPVTLAKFDTLVAWKCLDVHSSNQLKYDELFRMYKMLLTTALTDDQILELVFTALEHPSLETTGVITPNDFPKLVPDSEISYHFTVDLQQP